MSSNLFSRYLWLIDTIRRHGAITRSQLNELWRKTDFSKGEDMPRRTFYNYRAAIEEMFKINIECDPTTFEYYIDANGDRHRENVTDWMLNSATMSDVLSDAHDISHKIFLEDVPSARDYLSTVMSATRSFNRLRFTYSNYTRSKPTPNVVIEPYFLKLFRQRWYVIGRNVREDVIKTYALDRMSNVKIDSETFTIPEDFDAEAYYAHSFGIVHTKSEPKTVRLRVDSRQAKYFRALPLHHTQSEMISDDHSEFIYKLRLTEDLVQELLSYGPLITVMEPPELRAMMKSKLEDTLKKYK